jgi:carbonic anhydrase
VHRNIGNQVPGNDLNVLSVLEYAVGHLGVTDIIVTGHYACGAVKAASSRQDLGTLENWLRLIRDVYRLNREALDAIKDPEQFHQRLVELNVVEQCINVYKTGVVQRKRIETRTALEKAGKSAKEIEDGTFPRIHGLVFNPGEGILRRLSVDFAGRIGSLDHIYGLYAK